MTYETLSLRQVLIDELSNDLDHMVARGELTEVEAWDIYKYEAERLMSQY